MEINNVPIEDTFAEAFSIKVARALITGATSHWAEVAALEATGFGTSVIMCPAEAGIERYVSGRDTPDGRPGVYIQMCTFGYKALEEQLLARLGQCVLTAPTTSVFNGLPNAEKQLDVGYKLKFFGDGYERELDIGGLKCYAIPMMEGEFTIEHSIGAVEGVAGGNFFIFGENQMAALAAAENAVAAIKEVDGSITPFPGGVVASGSKVGAKKYTFLKATTNERFCTTLKGSVEDTNIPDGCTSLYEIVINGTSLEAVKESMRVGIEAAVRIPGILKIGAGNYGGELGKYHIDLHELLA